MLAGLSVAQRRTHALRLAKMIGAIPIHPAVDIWDELGDDAGSNSVNDKEQDDNIQLDHPSLVFIQQLLCTRSGYKILLLPKNQNKFQAAMQEMLDSTATVPRRPVTRNNSNVEVAATDRIVLLSPEKSLLQSITDLSHDSVAAMSYWINLVGSSAGSVASETISFGSVSRTKSENKLRSIDGLPTPLRLTGNYTFLDPLSDEAMGYSTEDEEERVESNSHNHPAEDTRSESTTEALELSDTATNSSIGDECQSIVDNCREIEMLNQRNSFRVNSEDTSDGLPFNGNSNIIGEDQFEDEYSCESSVIARPQPLGSAVDTELSFQPSSISMSDEHVPLPSSDENQNNHTRSQLVPRIYSIEFKVPTQPVVYDLDELEGNEFRVRFYPHTTPTPATHRIQNYRKS